MAYNSKYTGEEVEALLDSIRGGSSEMFTKTDVIANAINFKSGTVSLMVRDIIANQKIYLCFRDAQNTIVPFGDTLNSENKVTLKYTNGSSSIDLSSSIQPSHIGVGSIINIKKEYSTGSGDSSILYGVAFCDKAYSSWGAIPSEYKCVFKPEVSVVTGDWVKWEGLDGYEGYKSDSNVGADKHDTYSWVKVNINKAPDFKLYINSFAESGYDYVIAFELDAEQPSSSYITNSSQGALASTVSDSNGSPTTINNFKAVSYPNDGGEHFIWVVYRRDSSGYANDNRGYILIPRQ